MRYHDQHVHTNFSSDSKEIMENYVKKAVELGLEYVAITDHADFMAGWTKKDELFSCPDYFAEIKRLQALYPQTKILAGIEMGYRKEYIDEINQLLGSNLFDLIILSIHEQADQDYFYKEPYEILGIETVVNNYFNQILEGLTTIKEYDILGHIDYCFRSLFRHFQQIFPLDPYLPILEKIFKKIIELDKSWEINTSVYETTKSTYYIEFLVKLYLSLGGKNIVVASDCHDVSRFLSSFSEIFQLLKTLGVKELCFYVNRKKTYYKLEN
ncbi:MAG: histidinol-phosphatase HisJ family protein [Erysipelotrichales bacterium]|nr:histidinol-phosphatase HisJ family protein [Erysipelotrichales bacterium]